MWRPSGLHTHGVELPIPHVTIRIYDEAGWLVGTVEWGGFEEDEAILFPVTKKQRKNMKRRAGAEAERKPGVWGNRARMVTVSAPLFFPDDILI